MIAEQLRHNIRLHVGASFTKVKYAIHSTHTVLADSRLGGLVLDTTITLDDYGISKPEHNVLDLTMGCTAPSS